MTDPLLIMVAPNGARRTRNDHPALPMTIAETARCAAECFAAGAGAIHAHVRDEMGRHVLDADQYIALTATVTREAGQDMVVQITTEAVERYSPEEQRAVVLAVRPRAVSIGLREMLPAGAIDREALEFYGWCRREAIAVQHIVYDVGDLERLLALRSAGNLPGDPLAVLLVLGRYATGQQSRPTELLPFVDRLSQPDAAGIIPMVCAFGTGERVALCTAVGLGLHARTGFENSLTSPRGGLLRSNAEGVAAMSALAGLLERETLSGERALAVLGAG